MTSEFMYCFQITNSESVHVTATDPDGLESRLSGVFAWDAYKETLESFSLKARRNQGTLLDWQQLGEALFRTLLESSLQVHFAEWYRRAAAQHGCLNVQLDVDIRLTEIAALPWEFLRQPASAGYPPMWLGTAEGLTVTRRRSLGYVSDLRTGGKPLNTLLSVSAPSSLGPVTHKRIVATLNKLAKRNPEHFRPPRILLSTRLENLDREVKEFQPDIVHFIGHGRLRRGKKHIGELALNGPDKSTLVWVSDERFGALFERYKPWCIILQACEGAAVSESQALVGAASHLAHRNVPLVISFQFPVSNHAAISFCTVFYENWFAGKTAAAAVQEARRQLALKPNGYSNPDFATPVLFMQTKPDSLFSASSTQNNREDMHMELPRWPFEDHEALRLRLKMAFSLEELELLCAHIAEQVKQDTKDQTFTLSLEDIAGSAREAKVHNLIKFLDRREHLHYLVKAVQRQRPGLLDSKAE